MKARCNLCGRRRNTVDGISWGDCGPSRRAHTAHRFPNCCNRGASVRAEGWLANSHRIARGYARWRPSRHDVGHSAEGHVHPSRLGNELRIFEGDNLARIDGICEGRGQRFLGAANRAGVLLVHTRRSPAHPKYLLLGQFQWRLESGGGGKSRCERYPRPLCTSDDFQHQHLPDRPSFSQ